MTDDLYERYKESLRVGHVAVLRGALIDAVAAYRSAAEIAPSRALPHTSLGGVFLRLGHLEEALTEYATAVARAPHDEGALLGQAEALTAAGMRGEAALALDHVADIQESSDRLPEAADTLRRAIELDESVDRTRRQRALLREVRFAGGDQAAEQLLARALRLREEPAAEVSQPPAESAHGEDAAAETPSPYQTWSPERAYAAASRVELASPVEEEAPVLPGRFDVAPEPASPVEPAASPEPVVPEPERVPVAVAVAAEPPLAPIAAAAAEPLIAIPGMVGVMASVEDAATESSTRIQESAHQPTGDELLAAAEAADQSGDTKTLRSLLVWTARAYAREGRYDSALDAAHRLLLRYPGDVDAHLVLVELYVARSWDSLAAEKLKLLDRLAELNGDDETHQRICAAASRAFPNDESLQNICA